MKTLFVIDPQNDFISGVLGSKEAQKILPKIIEYVKNFDGLTFYTMDEHYNFDGETRETVLLPKHCIIDTIGRKIPQELEVELEKKDATCIRKDSFMPTDDYDVSIINELHDEYKNNDVEYKNNTIYVCGYCTDICVLNAVLYLRCNFPNDTIIVLKDLCAGTTPEKHEMALKVMESNLIEVK